MSSHNERHRPVMIRSPLPDIPRAAVKPSFARRDSLTSNLSARSKAYRDTLRMPAMIPAPEDDDNASRTFDGNEVRATMDTVDLKEMFKERYMETDAAKANAQLGLPEVRISSKKQVLPKPSSPRRNKESLFGSLFSKSSSKGYSLEELTQVEHKNTPTIFSTPRWQLQNNMARMTGLETDDTAENNVNHTPQDARNKKSWSKRNISLILVAIVFILAMAGVGIALSQKGTSILDEQEVGNGNGVSTPTASPAVSASTASPLTSLPTQSPTKKPTNRESTFAPTQSPTLGPTALDDARSRCDQAEEDVFVCIDLSRFVECLPDGGPQGQAILIFGSCPEGTSCACAPLTQFLASDLDICAPASSNGCEDII